MNEIFIISKKEFLDNWRNKWILAVSAIFMILTLVISYFGSVGSSGWQDLEGTIGGMMALVQLLVPIIALMLGYAAISGEKERGSIQLLLSYPLSKFELLLGKFLGLSIVIAFTNIVGFGVAGVVIGLNVSGVEWSDFIIFILSSILLGMVFIAISLLFSSIFKKRSTSLGGAIFIWFLFAMIWNIILSGILITQYGLDAITQDGWTGPNWYYVLSMINPIQAFSILVALNVTPIASTITNFPSFYQSSLMLVVLAAWILSTLTLGYFNMRRQDL